MAYHRSQGSLGNGITGRLDEYFDKKELPMYKDKPYNYASSTRKTSTISNPRVIALSVASFLIFLYWLGVFSSKSADTTSYPKPKASWSWFGGSGKSKDWEARRNAVKEAFILSWDGYDRYAWGMYTGAYRSPTVK